MTSYTRGYDLAKVGMLALVAATLFGALFLYMTNRGLAMRRSDVFVRLNTAGGLRRGDPVFFRGVEVGSVRKLQFVANGDVLVRAGLLERLPLTTNAHAELIAVDLFGRQSLVLRDGTGPAPQLESRDTLRGLSPTSMGATVAELGAKADRIVGDTTVDLVRAVLGNTAAASHQLQALTLTIERLVQSQHENLTQLTRDAAGIASNLRLATAPEPLQQTRDNVERSTENVQRATARLDTTTQRLALLISQVEQGNGSLGKLMQDPGLYERSEAVLASMEALLKDIKANPKRYINVKVF